MSEPKQYTTAIITAVPAENDPIHQVVAADAHVTLQFLGEAADLSEEQIAEIKTALEMLASVVYPFDADISGTAELGPDKAQVLIVQSALLTQIRDMLGTVGAVSTAVAASEQFPNWIPHLTLAYEGEMPDVSEFQSVTLGSIELWLAEEHHVFELSQAKPVTAAGEHVFEEGLHPRGADGRFIEKFGVIKYLTSQGWQYGKVEGIYTDKPSGAVKLTVTPSDLSGKTSGASIVLSPKQVYRAPKSKAHLTVSAVGVKKVGGQGGSNPGGLYEIPKITGEPGTTPEAEQFYVKKPKTASHGKNEALANALYEEAGVPVPEVDLASDGQLYSKIVKGQQDMAQQINNPEWADQVRRNFAVDAWLGNRDVFGLTYDNVLTDEHGVPWRIDNGGALLYRAMGAKKDDFGGKVTELDAFRTGKKAKIFGPGMTKAQEIDGAERVLAISPGQIDDMVKDHGLPQSLADTLKARRAYIADYYGLALPESKVPAEAEGPTSAPLVDAPDIAQNQGKTRNWFKSTLSKLAFFGQGGDHVELPDGSTQILGQGDDGPLSIVGMQAQVLGWTSKYQPDAEVFLRKYMNGAKPRPEHGSKLMGSDLTDQQWKRGDKIADADGQLWKIQSWNSDTGAMLIQSGDKPPLMLDTKGKDATGVWEVHRWDPPAAVDTSPIQTEDQASNALADVLAKAEAEPPKIQTLAAPPGEDNAGYESGFVQQLLSEDVNGDYAHLETPQPGKTGQAAEAETKIKADLDTPLPSGNGTPAPSKTTAPGGAKTMVIGDGTEAATGDSVTSKKDGKTYTFVKPKGQYAVVTDPNGEDPSKQLLKLASTMTQPGKTPAADVEAVEKPKTATGEVPALGMMAVAKDGWAGEITLISPDGKFVFITDANGKRKRKSTGTVSITSAPSPVGGGDAPSGDPANNTPPPDVPKPSTSPGPVKAYGPAPANAPAAKAALGGAPVFKLEDPADLDAADMVVVGYADGSVGLEPYSGQPLDSLLTNTTGKVAVSGTIEEYLGPISAQQLTQATTAVNGEAVGLNYTVVWNGHIMLANGSTGPNGGLMLWDYDTPSDYALEVPGDQILALIGNAPAAAGDKGVLPDPASISSAQFIGDAGFLPPQAPLYGDEAKTLAAWKADNQLGEGAQISLDGKNWLEVTKTWPNGTVDVTDDNGTESWIPYFAQSTFVLKAPELTDGNAPSSQWSAPDTPDLPEDLPVSTGKKKIGDLTGGDVVTDGNGETTIVDYVSDNHGIPDEVQIKALGEDFPSPANPNFELTYHGNIMDGPTSIPIGTAAPHLYPGAKVNLGTNWDVQLVSYPELLDNGNYRFAAMSNGDPEALYLIEVGDAPGSDVSGSVPVPVHLGSFTSAQDAGVDMAQLNDLINAAHVQPQTTATDHHIGMTDQGIPFGTAAYPIYYNGSSGTYFRAGHDGLQEWDEEAGAWNNVFGTVADKEKVWDGVPFTGELSLPEGYPSKIMADSNGTLLADYKPQPGETIQVAKVQGDQQSILISYPSGLSGPAHMLVGANGLTPAHSSASPFQDGWKESGAFTELATIHDPFAEASPVDTVTHQQGPQPPAVVGAKLQAYGYTPKPGETFWVTQLGGTGTVSILSKQEDGTYRRINSSGELAVKAWSAEELAAYDLPGETVSHYTWTYLPEGADAPATVQGLPQGFAPYVPGEGQSVLKVTLPNGKENVYVQKQPGAGWYEMGSDGVVLENSDAVKSDFVVQQKLAGKGNQTAKYDLLYPTPEGEKSSAAEVPTFHNEQGAWTPEPHQSVVVLTGNDSDPDPWYLYQDTPGGDWTPAPNSPGLGSDGYTDSEMQDKLEAHAAPEGEWSGWKLAYNGQSGQAAVDTPGGQVAPTFSGYTPQPGQKVLAIGQPGAESYYVQSEPGGKWQEITDTGQVVGNGVSDSMVQSELSQNSGDMRIVWDGTQGASAPGTAEDGQDATPVSFGGYTPAEGDKVVSADLFGKQTFLVQQAGTSDYKLVKTDGTINPHGGATQTDIENGNIENTQVWPPAGAAGGPAQAGTFGGYQTKPGDAVLQLEGNGTYYIKPDGNTVWHKVNPDGTLSTPEDGYSQDTMEWAAGEYGLTELQGTLKPGTPATPEPLETTGEAYAGVAQDTNLNTSSYGFGTYTPSTAQASRIVKLGTLHQGQSMYVLEDATGTIESSAVLVRHSDGSWSTVLTDGTPTPMFSSDAELEQWVSGNHYNLHKAQFQAPKAAPAPVSTGPKMQLTGWGEKGVPAPASFNYVSDISEAASAKAGDYIFVSTSEGTGGGLVVQLSHDVDPASGTVKASKILAVDAGGVISPSNAWIPAKSDKDPFVLTWGDANNYYVSAGLAPSAAPVAAPAAPATPSPVPTYPGQHKPSQEDINSWGGDLTKDGHIPTPGMFVTGKGPMSGKIVGVSKDKTKATVLTSDGKKTTRLIAALKTDASANYSAYAAPVTAKDIPAGMPLAVDTVAEALEKTAKDGKFRAILSDHPGVSQGQMVVTKTTAPSGKVFNRVHLTLTPDQRAQLVAMLSGTGEKGDWAKSSKMSDAVAIGDQIPMRKSSTDNPDGTPRWKVDSSITPPTHTVTGVADEPGGTGIKLVTMKNLATGEEIISRFHPGKSLTVYTWDPNKPKVMTAGAFAMSDLSKAQGWELVKDGGISAISGGADKGQLYNEPGKAVTKSALGQVSHTWQTLRNVSADGVVIETVDPQGSPTYSTTGVTVISVPEGVGQEALGAALAKLGIDYSPMTQDGAKNAVRGVLRTLLSLDTSDVDTAKGWSDEKLFAQAGKTMGISDLGWQDVLVGVDESTGKTSYFWSDRARNALAGKASYNVVYRAASTANAAQIVSTVKYGSASSILKKTTGMLDGSGSVGNGASASSDNSNHAGHGSYASAASHAKLPSSNKFAGYKSAGMMIYHRPEAVLGRIMDIRVASNDAFGMGKGQGADHLAHATSMSQVRDYFLGGGLPTEAVGFIAVDSAAERDKAITQLKADGFAVINGRPVEDIVITKQKAATLSPSDMPPVTIPSNARPILSLPTSYDAPAPAGGAVTADASEAAA